MFQESKIEEWNISLIRQVWGNRWIDWAELKALGTRGGDSSYVGQKSLERC